MLQIRAKECKAADYIKESLHLFLDIFNIFVRLMRIEIILVRLNYYLCINHKAVIL